MPKRKYERLNEGQSGLNHRDGTFQAQQDRLEALVEHGKKSLFRALKVARGFERQKLGRRQKVAHESNFAAEEARLIAEVKALKSLDLTVIAELHHNNAVTKIKSIASSPAFPEHILSKAQLPSQAQDVATTNVTARLFNSNPVKTAMVESLASIRELLRIGDATETRKKRSRAADFTSERLQGKARLDGKDAASTAIVKESSEQSEWDGVAATDGSEKQFLNTGTDEDNSNYEKYAARLACSSSNGDSDDEALATISIDGHNQRNYDSTKELSLSPTPSNSSPPPSPPNQHTKSSKHVAPAPKSTTFLPSLMMSGYYSGSEAESAAFDDNNDDATDIKRRKNRMGQQARRQLWEKKFGHKANHVKTQSRDQGWDARKGAQGGDDRGKRGRGRGRGRGGRYDRGSEQARSRDGNMSRGSGANSDPVRGRTETEAKAVEGPLHPSWVAAIKAKEQKKSVAFEGKKITFE